MTQIEGVLIFFQQYVENRGRLWSTQKLNSELVCVFFFFDTFFVFEKIDNYPFP